ncbi:MAG: ABC transporter ATP-binding protein [Campylobacterota bacterium]
MAKPLLEAKGLSFSFDYELFNDIDLTLHEAESIAIVGVSGSGKSTLLHNLSSFLPPKSGDVFIQNQNIYTTDCTELRRKKLGIIFQFHYLFKSMSALQNIEIASLIADNKVENSLLDKLGIRSVVNQHVTELSGGQQQRVSIARVLSKQPKLIFADEPTGNLDKQTAASVMRTLHEYIKNCRGGLFIVTHDRELAMQCDRVYELKDKQLQRL